MGQHLTSTTSDHKDGLPNPHWLSAAGRKLLQKSASHIKPDLVVAQDGSGKYKTISAALNAIPHKSKKRTVIYVKNGVYKEKVLVQSSKLNIRMIGGGMGAIIVTGSLHFVDGTPYFSKCHIWMRLKDAPVVVQVDGFSAILHILVMDAEARQE